MPSPVAEIPAAEPDLAAAHYAAKLAFETDCSDVHAAFAGAKVDFILLDVRSPALFAQSHLPGAVNLPHGKMTAHRMTRSPAIIGRRLRCGNCCWPKRRPISARTPNVFS